MADGNRDVLGEEMACTLMSLVVVICTFSARGSYSEAFIAVKMDGNSTHSHPTVNLLKMSHFLVETGQRTKEYANVKRTVTIWIYSDAAIIISLAEIRQWLDYMSAPKECSMFSLADVTLASEPDHNLLDHAARQRTSVSTNLMEFTKTNKQIPELSVKSV